MKRYGEKIWNNIRKCKTLPHVATWENFMETHVPEGCVIHHIDQNKLNNDILNLVCMTRSEHQKWHSKGKIFSEETRRKISECQKGRKLSKEVKENMSKIHMGKKGTTTGTHHSQEAKDKISNGLKKYYLNKKLSCS